MAETNAIDPRPMSTMRVALYFLSGNLLPSVGLFLMLRGSPLPASWQSGEFHDYVTFLLSSRTAALFYPFFLYSIACFTLGLFEPEIASRHSWVRFGIYSGVLLAIQYWLVVGVVVLQVEHALAWNEAWKLFAIPAAGLVLVGVPSLLYRLLVMVKRNLERRGFRSAWVVLLMFAAPGCGIVFGLGSGNNDAEEWVFTAAIVPGLAAVVATPVWMAAVFGDLARRVRSVHRSRFQLRLIEQLAIFSWLAAYMAAWRFAVVETISAYGALPTSPPSGCYVATAAAHGHPALVQSWTIACGNGVRRRVNMQLAYLKCGELVFKATSPSLHARVRRAYDALGPKLACCLVHPFAADAAYLLLKPVEWTARAVVAIAVPDGAAKVRRLYRGVGERWCDSV